MNWWRVNRVPLFVLLAVATQASGQLVITKIDKSGLLTWTNTVTNATYRLETRTSTTSEWLPLTNLASIHATNSTVAVQSVALQAPGFYRVVWANAEVYDGLFDLHEYDLQGNLVVTGRLWLAAEPGFTNPDIWGTRDLHFTGHPTNIAYPTHVYGDQFEPAQIEAAFSPELSFIGLSFNLNIVDDNVTLHGLMGANMFIGHWYWIGIGGPAGAQGNFTATKLNADPLPPPHPKGLWSYEGWLGGAMVITGSVSFATSESPLAGSWIFGNRVPPSPVLHLLGQGDFTNASVVGNLVTIVIPTANGPFTLQGQMSGDGFTGWWIPPGGSEADKDIFWACRKGKGSQTKKAEGSLRAFKK